MTAGPKYTYSYVVQRLYNGHWCDTTAPVASRQLARGVMEKFRQIQPDPYRISQRRRPR